MRHDLNYMPTGYSRRYPIWKLAFPFTVMIILTVYWWAGARREMPETAPFVALFLSVLFALLAYVLLSGRAWQLRIEGTMLSFRRPHDEGWATCEINDIAEINSLSILDNRKYELVFCDGRRVLVESMAFKPYGKFCDAISAVKSTIRFDSRAGHVCHACGNDTPVRPRRCSSCNAMISGELPAVPKGGIVLPDAIDASS